MKIRNKLFTSAVVVALGVATAMFGLVGSASAACIQYNPSGFNTPTTPVFNNICGVPDTGNESDFVRIRQSVNGNDEDNQNNPNFTVGSLSAACTVGDKFDLWNYLHNDATQDANNNGNGTAVAHNVQMALTAPLGTASNSFTFGDTVTASNADTVHDSVVLNCGNNQVQLTLVPGSVHIFSVPYTSWLNLPDSTINGNTKLGSPTPGSGDMWGCWTYRIVVVYQVQVTPVPPTPVPPVCTLLTGNVQNQVARIDSVTYTANDAHVSGITLDFGNGFSKTLLPNEFPTPQSPFVYNYPTAGNFTIRATVLSDLGNVTSNGCTMPASPTTPPPATFISTPPVPTPKQLPNTGSGNIFGIFAATSVIGAVGHRLFANRRQNKHN